jgi:hypothetical protein
LRPTTREDAAIACTAHAALFHFTHDILRNPAAIGNVLKNLKPGACVVATALMLGLEWLRGRRRYRPRLRGRHRHPGNWGLTVPQALEIIRGCFGLNIIGGDLVEVSPPYDLTGKTALLGANLLFEMLCVLPGVKRRCVS